MTASVTLLPEITRKIGVPRALAVPYPLGYPLGAPGDVALQSTIVRSLLALCARTDVPLLAELDRTETAGAGVSTRG